jgi:hypothetical protein
VPLVGTLDLRLAIEIVERFGAIPYGITNPASIPYSLFPIPYSLFPPVVPEVGAKSVGASRE